ncbi:DUF7343 domain-containing protein [Methanococcus aeolicus]|uniref:DUF7343 domain-containing protein n=1 Tax=Methanococcus aeolicus TaxID=42879 RepID=UPI0021C79E85|nr:MarR family transcriptional regulator [Methanococcus aeolicus]UXM84403.1 winged helix-turn-helix transcriptional regulator [Methanococcus aeolicus]
MVSRFKKFEKFKILFSLLLLLSLGIFNSASAIKFENYDVVCDIDSNNKINTTINLEIYNNTEEIKEITYIIPHKINNLNVKSSSELDTYSSILSGSSTEVIIKFKNPIKKGEKGNLIITFTGDLVWDKENKKLLSFSVPAVDSDFTMIIKLPMGASVVSPAEGLLSITPQDYTIDTDGKRIFVKWNKQLRSSDKFFTSTVSYAILAPNTNNSNIVETQNGRLDTIYYMLCGVLILITLGSFYGIYYEKNKNRRKNNTIKEILKEKEKLLDEINIIKEKYNDEQIKSNNKLKELEKDLENKLNIATHELNLKDESISELNKELNNLKNENNKLNVLISELKTSLEKSNNDLKNKLKNKDAYIEKIETTNKTLNSKISELTLKIEELNKAINAMEQEQEQKLQKKQEQELQKEQEYKQQIDGLNKELLKYRSELRKKEKEIIEFKNLLDNYEKTKEQMFMNILTEDEKMIINLIKSKEEITQKEIVEITGLTKPKVSRIVSDLVERGIIRKVKIGRINKLIISDELNGWL